VTDTGLLADGYPTTPPAGALPDMRRAAGEFSATDEAEYLSKLCTAVADVVARQRETDIDLVNDGEYGHSMGMNA
jgi:methionine synthase II (cobalamin-independent)